MSLLYKRRDIGEGEYKCISIGSRYFNVNTSRYIYLWINYALFEELQAEDMERTREVYKAALNVIPHRIFTFAKIWLMFSNFEVRQLEINQARKILGNAIGMCPKTKLFRGYIELELELREFGRTRILYEKFLEYNPSNCTTWIKYAELESILGKGLKEILSAHCHRIVIILSTMV